MPRNGSGADVIASPQLVGAAPQFRSFAITQRREDERQSNASAIFR
jgi:hypothetical protein